MLPWASLIASLSSPGTHCYSPGDPNEQPGLRVTGFNHLNDITDINTFLKDLAMCCAVTFVYFYLKERYQNPVQINPQEK